MNSTITIAIVTICAFAAVFLLVYGATPQSDAVQRKLANYAGDPGIAAKRILIFDQIFNERQRSKIVGSLQEAGWYKMSPAKFGLYKVGGGIVGGAAALGAIFFFNLSGLPMLICGMLPIAGYIMPQFSLDRAIKVRKSDIASELPDFLDAVSSAVSAGVALNAAMLTAVDMVPGPLGSEFRAALADIRMGRSRSDAMSAMSMRINQTDVSQLVTALIQSERIGGNISQVLDELAEEARNRRFTRAEEIAAVLPLKMTFPMALLLLPALFVMIFAPVIAGVLSKQ